VLFVSEKEVMRTSNNAYSLNPVNYDSSCCSSLSKVQRKAMLQPEEKEGRRRNGKEEEEMAPVKS
jgi:hypothetical protein